MGKNHLDNIAIVGSGLAGLTLAISLAEKGIPSTIFEKESEDNLGGMGIQITPNGSEILARLGLEVKLREISSPGENISVFDGLTSKRLYSMDLTQFAKGDELGYITCHRGSLIQILCERAKKLGVTFYFNQKIFLEEFSTEKAIFRSEDGKEYSSSLLLGADGYGSAIGQKLNPDGEKHKSDFIALRGLVPMERIDAGDIKSGVNLFMYPGQHLVTYLIDKGKQLNFVAIRPDVGRASSDSDLTELISGFSTHPYLDKLLNNASEVRTNYLSTGFVQPIWFSGRVCLCGDALHPMPPFLAQGGNMAIEDGWVLASVLRNKSNPKESFNLFKAKRFSRLNRIVRLSNSQTWINHLRGGLMYQLRNTTLALVDKSLPGLIASRYTWIYRGY